MSWFESFLAVLLVVAVAFAFTAFGVFVAAQEVWSHIIVIAIIIAFGTIAVHTLTRE